MDNVRKMVEAGFYLGTLEADFRAIKDSLVNGRVTQTIGRLTGHQFKIQNLIADLSEIEGAGGERGEEGEGAATTDASSENAQEDPVSAIPGSFGEAIVEGAWEGEPRFDSDGFRDEKARDVPHFRWPRVVKHHALGFIWVQNEHQYSKDDLIDEGPVPPHVWKYAQPEDRKNLHVPKTAQGSDEEEAAIADAFLRRGKFRPVLR